MFPSRSDAPSPNNRPLQLSSLRAELLVGLGILAAAALIVAVLSVVLFWEFIDSGQGALWLALLVAGDVAVFIALGAYQLKRLVTTPLMRAVEATSAIAGGDLSRRVPDASTRELATLATSINRMTDHLLAEGGVEVLEDVLGPLRPDAFDPGQVVDARTGQRIDVRERLDHDLREALADAVDAQ